MKPIIRKVRDTKYWECGGLKDSTGMYVDWYLAKTPVEAYKYWKSAQKFN